MSNSEVEEESEEEEEEEEAEESEEEFYESLDRVLSSSCSSTSASDDDADHRHHHRGGGGGGGRRCPCFPAAAASLDVWIAEPAPVEERRRRLLLQMGLAGDPALTRRGAAPDACPAPPEMGRSVSCDGAFPSSSSASSHGAAAASVIGRSRSEGSVDPNPVNRPVLCPQRHRHRHQRSAAHGPISSKPPLVGRSRPFSAGNLEVADGDEGDGEGKLGERGEEDEDEAEGGGRGDPKCLIKNLDTGREFAVKEFREDGMWNKLREVGTGRQLTMEEFEMCVGRSPIVQELMRRQNVEDSRSGGGGGGGGGGGSSGTAPRSGGSDAGNGARSKKRGGWLRSIKNVVAAGGHHRDRRSSDEKDTSSEKGGGRRSSSATDDSQDGPHPLGHGPQRTKVRHFGKSHKELTGLYMSQEIQAHSGSIWSIKFSPDGRYLASAGEDRVIHVWEVRKGEFLIEKGLEENGNNCYPFVAAVSNGSPEPNLALACVEGNHLEKKGRARVSGRRKSASSDHLMAPDHVFALSEKPVCSFRGHMEDVLDLSWSKSQRRNFTLSGNVEF